MRIVSWWWWPQEAAKGKKAHRDRRGKKKVSVGKGKTSSTPRKEHLCLPLAKFFSLGGASPDRVGRTFFRKTLQNKNLTLGRFRIGLSIDVVCPPLKKKKKKRYDGEEVAFIRVVEVLLLLVYLQKSPIKHNLYKKKK